MDQLISSVLFKSPYSGCGNFSGWPEEPCHKAVGWIPATPQARPGTLLCVDRCHKTLRAVKPPPGACCAPAQVSAAPTQAGRFTIAGPSANGPYTWQGPWNYAVGALKR